MGDIQIPSGWKMIWKWENVMLCYSLRTCMSRKWMLFWPVVRSRPWMMSPQLDAKVLPRLAQRRLWLDGLIRERQTFPHLAQVWMVAGYASLVPAFRLALFSSARVWTYSSPALSCLWSVERQLLRSAAMSSQLWVLMSMAFRSRLQTSL